MGNEVKSSTSKKKPLNKKAKFIWYGVSLVIFFIGVILVKAGISFEGYALKAAYAVAVLFPMLVAAQKVSYERYGEDGKRNIKAYALYYFCIISVIVLIPFIFWVDQFVAIG